MRIFTCKSFVGLAWTTLTITLVFTSASPLHIARNSYNSANLPLPSHVVTQFPNGTWIENIAVRSNGDLLATILGPPALYSISNQSSHSPSVTLVETFSGSYGLTGIAEAAPDLFVVAGYMNTAVSTVDFNTLDVAGKPTTKTLTTITEAVLINGVARLSDSEVLLADTYGGIVWRLDVTTGQYENVVELPELTVPNGNATVYGVNGIKVHEGYLYWTNSHEAIIYRLEINSDGTPAEGALVNTVAKLDAVFLDDFTFDKDGNIWVASNQDNQLFAVAPCGESVVLVEGGGTDLTVAGDTSAAFGRGRDDQEVLYVVTSGTSFRAAFEGGKVVAVGTRGFNF